MDPMKTDLPPGTYRAVYRLSTRYVWQTPKLFHEIEHCIIVNPDGTIVEPFFVSHPCRAVETFDPPRRWGNANLKAYNLTAIDHETMSRMRSQYDKEEA